MRSCFKGDLSELLVAREYIRTGWAVFFPFGHDTEIDLVVTKGPRIKRVQVKTAYECGNILRVNIDHKKKAKYTADTLDTMVCVYKDRIWSIPMESIEGETTLNFGRIDGKSSKTRGNFDHTRYEVTNVGRT